ncbi:COX15/CtaA family protein [Halocalculus aciditolerans]|uniref:Cytochrome c oxidase assembly protein subunit 15 n=1 Tax=Halocalculus aciditolerans TaxID=1383812 RepID=A0A830FDB9_9EURY|nr:COX15/CtaA family protein [Halocalculus aciditolerans]GGL63717.1 hypothetical protein GCM10009039_22040 [Halocalculus aciditolerans]
MPESNLFESTRAFRWLVTISLVGTLILMGAANYSVALGGWMSCGDQFPKCAGVYAPIFHPVETLSGNYTAAQIFWEWFHRASAFITGLTMLAATGLAWWKLDDYTVSRWLVTAATAVLPAEAYLGVQTGVADPPFDLVVLHNVISWFVLLTMAAATVIVWRAARRDGGKRDDAAPA